MPDLSDEDLALVLRWVATSVPVNQWSKTIAKDDLRMLVQHVAPMDVFVRRLGGSAADLVDYLKVWPS